jgi:hypothetical protein
MTKVKMNRLAQYFNDSLEASGDVVMVGAKDFTVFTDLLKRSNLNNKSFNVLHDKSLKLHLDKISEKENHEWVSEKLPESCCFAFIDVMDAERLSSTLEELIPRMSYGSTLFFKDYSDRDRLPHEKVIKNFITMNKRQLTVARQMVVYGSRETSLVVKWFPMSQRPNIIRTNEKITVATVLKLGGDYDVSYVNALANACDQHLTIPYEFVCLTDCEEGFNNNVNRIVPLEFSFERWWSKMELFIPNKFKTERIFYMDLDTIITDNIDDIATYSGNFFGLRDFYNQVGLGSGLMAWGNDNPTIFQIYEKFMENPESNIRNHRMGDQEFIDKVLGKYMEYAQDLYPNRIYSYKKDCVDAYKNIKIPDTASIVCFHGKPRPHQVKDPEITQYFNP